MIKWDEILNQAYLGKRVHDLLTTLTDQLALVYRANGITVPVPTSSTVQFLSENQDCSAADIARSLDITHQLATQRIEKLRKAGLVEKQLDQEDGRRVCWRLTADGKLQAHRLSSCMLNAIQVHESLFEETGINLLEAIDTIQAALAKQSLAQRFAALSANEEAG